MDAMRSAVDRYAPRIARKYRERRDGRHDFGHAQPTPWGFTLRGDADLAASRDLSHEADIFLSLLGSADHVIDVGANAGLFTLMAASEGVPVTAVEPSPLNLGLLYQNLGDNGLRAEVLPVAVSDHVSISDLYGGGQGASLVRGWGGVASTYITKVPTWRLDDLFASRLSGQRLIIKIDAEGAELPILRGATRLLAADPPPVWIVEIGLTENFGGHVNPDFESIFEVFWSAGYRAKAVEAEVPVGDAEVAAWVATGKRPFWNINYLFIK